MGEGNPKVTNTLCIVTMAASFPSCFIEHMVIEEYGMLDGTQVWFRQSLDLRSSWLWESYTFCI